MDQRQVNSGAKHLADDIERLIGQLDGLRGKVVQVADAVLHDVQHRLHDIAPPSTAVRRNLEQQIEQLSREFSALGSRLNGAGSGASRRTVRLVQEQPLLSLGIAFGAGYLIARWIKHH